MDQPTRANKETALRPKAKAKENERQRERERERHIKETSSANINISRRAKRKIDTIDVSVTHFLLMHEPLLLPSAVVDATIYGHEEC